MLHHPLIAAGVAYWALLTVTIRLDWSAIVVGILPTATVVVQYLLARRLARKIASDSASKIGEVHALVNSQHDQLKGDIDGLRAENHALYDRLAALPPPANESAP